MKVNKGKGFEDVGVGDREPEERRLERVSGRGREGGQQSWKDEKKAVMEGKEEEKTNGSRSQEDKEG